MYIIFSHHVSVRSKTSKRRCSYSAASFDNAVCGQTRDGLSFLNINWLGASRKRQPCVAAFANGITIGCKLRLDLTLS